MNRKIIRLSSETLKRIKANSKKYAVINMHEAAERYISREHCPVCGSIDVVGGCCRHCHAYTNSGSYLFEA